MTAPGAPQALQSSVRPTARAQARSMKERRSVVEPLPRPAARPNPMNQERLGPTVAVGSRQERADSTTVPSESGIGANRPARPRMARARSPPELNSRTALRPAEQERLAAREPEPEPEQAEAVARTAAARKAAGRRPAAARPTQAPALQERAAAKEGSAAVRPSCPSSARALPPAAARMRAAIPRSAEGRACREPPGGPWASPTSAPEPREVRRERPKCPGRAWRAMPPAGPSLEMTMAAPRQSAPSGSACELQAREVPRSRRLPLTGLARRAERVAPPSYADGVSALACRGCRRPAPSPPGLCMRIRPTSGGEPPLSRFRPEISDVKQQSRSAEVWHPGPGVEGHESTEPSITRRPDAIPGTVMSASSECAPAPSVSPPRTWTTTRLPSGRSSRRGSGASAAWVSIWS